jgi:glycosyltransferase involved in cell wall biosynthesis
MKNSDRLKIVMIITGLEKGGAESMLVKLCEKFDRNNFELTIISLTAEGKLGQKIKSLNIPLYDIGLNKSIFQLNKFLKLYKLLKLINPSIVHTWMYHSDLIGGIIAKLVGVKIIIWGIRHYDLSLKKNKLSTLLIVRLCAILSYFIPTMILTCARNAIATHASVGYDSRKFYVIPNGFNTNEFKPNLLNRKEFREELLLQNDSILVGIIARANPQKNLLGFIEAAIKVAEKRENVFFIMVGTGIDKSNIEITSSIMTTTHQERFFLLGSRDDIPRILQSLDILSLTSWGEGFPNVLGEAMATGIPCVSTDVGDSKEIIGEFGRVAKPGDMSAIAEAIIYLIDNQEIRKKFGTESRKRIKKFYSIESVACKYQLFYKSLISSN